MPLCLAVVRVRPSRLSSIVLQYYFLTSCWTSVELIRRYLWGAYLYLKHLTAFSPSRNLIIQILEFLNLPSPRRPRTQRAPINTNGAAGEEASTSLHGWT